VIHSKPGNLVEKELDLWQGLIVWGFENEPVAVQILGDEKRAQG
jgi:hypothetical protein